MERSYKKRALLERVMEYVFLAAACVSVLCVALICAFLLANGLPAMGEIGVLKFLSGTRWKPGADIYGIFPMTLGSIYVTAGALLMVPKGVYHAQHNAGTPFTHWRYIAVDSDRMLAQSPHWCAKAIRTALQTTWHGGVYLPPGDEDGARAASIIHTMFDLERSGGNVLPELEAYLLLLLTGKLPVYGFLLFAIISREFYKPFLALESHWVNYLTVTDSYRRIKKITEAETVPEPERPIHPTEYAISFEDVSFSYEEGGFTMQNISFHTPAQTLTALVGGSGSGKTTITNLLLRFWDVTDGAIRIGGVDVRDMSYDELLGSVSIVMQNVQLFADTIEGNIRLGKAAATQEEIITAAKKARIHDFIMSLPDGYQTMIGENGVGLSGGQKQRLSIARAFLKDAPILLLDEITSNVDPVNEALIQEAISELAKDRTVLVIAHHLSTIRSADQILVFQDGRIVQSGQHETLLSDSDGYYHKLWNARGSKEVNANEGLCG